MVDASMVAVPRQPLYQIRFFELGWHHSAVSGPDGESVLNRYGGENMIVRLTPAGKF